MIEVLRTRDFDRIVALPRRTITRERAQEYAAQLTPLLALPGAGAKLFPWQAFAIAECVDNEGGWLALPVGTGKTLISYLLPLVMRSQRALLIVPGALLSKTYADFRELRTQWHGTRTPTTFLTREKLSIATGYADLERAAPDLIVIDEADDLASPTSGATRKLDRYVREHPGVRVVAMTGTPSRKSIMGYWHILCWCLGSRAPVPMGQDEASIWALALDLRPGGPGAHPGPLGDTQGQARAWYRARLTETPGVVVIDEDSCDAPLTVRVRLAREDATIDAAFARFLLEQESPGGIPVSDPLSLWRLDAQLGLGLYTYWDPEPPEAWRTSRRVFARFVRDAIERSTRTGNPLDTERQVVSAHAGAPAVVDWLATKPTFSGRTRTAWISRSTLDSVHDWLRDLEGVPGIVWCGSVAFGRAAAKEAALEYYGQQGRSDNGHELHSADESRSLVASWGANKKGFNLQPWTRQLVVMPPQSAKWLEQIFGRSHRAGQREHVIVDVLATSGCTIDAVFGSALDEARTVRDRDSLTQKLLRADIVRVKPMINATNEYRWATRAK